MKRMAFFFVLLTAACLSVKASQDSLQQYVARYKFPEGSPVNEVNVILENGTLQITSILGNSALEKSTEDQFSIVTYNGTASFIRNSAKKIIGLKIEAMGIIMEGVREEGNSHEDGKIILPMKFPIPMMPTDL
jgi:DNA-binding transcriptional MocR family regulator